MDQPNYDTTHMLPEEDGGIDFIALLKTLWAGKWTIIITIVIFMALGLVAALTMQRVYNVSTVMVPQMSNNKGSSLGNLASLVGLNLGQGQSDGEISPLVYPKIVSSVPFLKELMYTPVHYADVDTAVSMFTYYTEIDQPTIMDNVIKYTIGLPALILSSLRSKPEPIVMPADSTGSNAPKPVVVSEDEKSILLAMSRMVSLDVEKKDGYLTLNVTGTEPVMTAELALKAQQMLQEELTRFRIEKSQSELDYIQARYNEIKAEMEMYQEQLARVTDRSQDVTTTRDRIGRDRIQTKFNLAYTIFNEIAKQLEQAKMQVKKDTPVFTILQPVVLPTKPANSRAKTLIIWTFMGIILGAGLVLGKDYWSKFKTQFQNSEVNS